jgi:hypothetical protein
LVYQTVPELKVQMKHFFAFAMQLLMLQVSSPDLPIISFLEKSRKSSFEVFAVV